MPGPLLGAIGHQAWKHRHQLVKAGVLTKAGIERLRKARKKSNPRRGKVATAKQKAAARKNIKKAQAARRKKNRKGSKKKKRG